MPDAPSLFDSEIGKERGIYLWTVPMPEGALVYYVGETGDCFNTRLLSHYLEHAAGMYHLHEPTMFAKGKKKLVWSGRYDSENKKSVSECILVYPRLTAVIHELTQILRFHLAPLSCEARMRRRIEAAIAGHLYQQPGMVGSFQDKIRYQPRRGDEAAISVRLETSCPVLGFASELDA